MKLLSLIFFLIITVINGSDAPSKPAKEKVESKPHKAPLKVLSNDELNALLAKRVNSGLDSEFGAFANKFMVFSGMSTGISIGLKGTTEKIVSTELQPVFPSFYKPRLSELFDMIALQTKSVWSYEKEDQFVSSTVEDEGKPDANMAIITFKSLPMVAATRRPFTVTLANDWKREDMGHWDMLVPPSASVGMDIYEMGRYSTKDPSKLADLMAKVRKEVSLNWAGRVVKEPQEEDFKPAKVGPYDALHFVALIPSRLNKDVRWRQWVITVGDQCFFIVSTLFPDQEEALFPDVKSMLDSFKVEAK